jgi:thioredoxin 1
MQRLTPLSRRVRATSDATPARIGSAALKLTLITGLVLGVATTARAELPSATETDIRQALASGHPTVIDLGARSCIPCKKMAPILESLADTYRGKAGVLFVDVHDDDDTARTLGVQMIPTQVFFDAKGQEAKRHIGFMDGPALVEELKALGVE